MYSQVAWVLISLEIQVQPQIMLSPDYLTDYFSVSYDYENIDIGRDFKNSQPCYFEPEKFRTPRC